jgi:hypothetical protein
VTLPVTFPVVWSGALMVSIDATGALLDGLIATLTVMGKLAP